jgi:hypothetical protein
VLDETECREAADILLKNKPVPAWKLWSRVGSNVLHVIGGVIIAFGFSGQRSLEDVVSFVLAGIAVVVAVVLVQETFLRK